MFSAQDGNDKKPARTDVTVECIQPQKLIDRRSSRSN